MPIPDFQTLMLPALRRLAASQWATRDLIAALSEEFGLTYAERVALLPSGQATTMANRVTWAVAYLAKAGLVSRVGRARYGATDRGRTALETAPDRITVPWLRRFPEFQETRTGDASRGAESLSVSDTATSVATPRERLEVAEREMRAALADELLARVRDLSPTAFEQLIVDLLLRMGYGGTRADAAQRLGRTGDGGVDGVIRGDALGLDAVYLQAKRYAADNTVGSGAIREFSGSLLARGATKGVFVTTSGFSRAALEDRDRLAMQQRIVLIGGTELAALMMEHEVGVRTVQTVRVQRLDLETYEEEAG